MNNERAISKADLKKAGLSYTQEKMLRIKRQKRGKGFSFIRPTGSIIKNKTERLRLVKMAVPPSYENVWYSSDPNSHLQATGYDSQGKKQYFYHPLWEALRDKNKFALMAEFGEKLPSFRRKIIYMLKKSSSDKEQTLCGMIRILDKTGMRIGNKKAMHIHRTYGLTTLCERHIDLNGNDIHFEYKGKGGGDIEYDLHDPLVAKVLENCLGLSGTHLFNYEDAQGHLHPVYSNEVNQYIQTYMGEGFSAKDFRTWRFSCLFLEELLKQQEDFTLTGVLNSVVKRTCNTAAILKSSYIHPGLLKLCKEKDIKRLHPPRKNNPYLRKCENYLLGYVKTRHAKIALRETA